MITKYWAKKDLYMFVDELRTKLKITLSPHDYPINSIDLGKRFCKNLTIDQLPFPTSSICGILYKGEKTTSIALNSNRDPFMQNFDCMHELIHYFFHDISFCQLMCSEKTILQDKYIEWQANEGAAQFLIPYQLFIPKYIELEKKYAHSYWGTETEEELAKFFNVSVGVISNRIKNLENEIIQYKQHSDIKKITLISKQKIIQWGLNKYKLKKLYCIQCLSPLKDNDLYCPICGNCLLQDNKFINIHKREGSGFMKYNDGIKIDSKSKARECPICQNEELENGEYCKICGTYIINKCAAKELDINGNEYFTCNQLAEGNARFCIKCGHKTTFFENDLLKNWKNTNSIFTLNDEITDDKLPF